VAYFNAFSLVRLLLGGPTVSFRGSMHRAKTDMVGSQVLPLGPDKPVLTTWNWLCFPVRRASPAWIFSATQTSDVLRGAGFVDNRWIWTFRGNRKGPRVAGTPGDHSYAIRLSPAPRHFRNLVVAVNEGSPRGNETAERYTNWRPYSVRHTSCAPGGADHGDLHN